jgi:hypothetical protein
LLKERQILSFDLLLKENQKKANQKVLGANRNLLAFPKDYHFTIDTKYVPTGCFFSIRNGGFSDEFHEFRKVLNPEMTNAYFQKHLYSPVWVRECLPKCKGQVVVWGNQNIKGSSDLYGSIFKYNSQNFKNYQDTILLDKGKTSFKYCRS